VLEEVFGPEVHRYLEKDAAAAPIGKNLYQVDYLRGCDNSGLEPKYLVKWVGWVEPDGDTWEYESSLHPSLVRLYAQCQQSGARFPTYLERLAGKEQSTRLNDGLSLLPPKPEEPALGEDLFRIPVLEMMQMVNDPGGCRGNIKVHQRGEPKGGYRSHVGGLLAANNSANICLDWDWFRNSESFSANLFFITRIFHDCPELLDELEIITQDDGCHFKKCLASRLRAMIAERGANEPDTPAMALYRKILDKVIVVDRFHFKNHKETDHYCMKQTNPTLEVIPVGLEDRPVALQELMEGENSESSEQLFRWMGRLKHIINEMALSRATFFIHRMVWIHNERTVEEASFRTAF